MALSKVKLTSRWHVIPQCLLCQSTCWQFYSSTKAKDDVNEWKAKISENIKTNFERHFLRVFCQSDLIEHDYRYKLIQIFVSLKACALLEHVADPRGAGMLATLERHHEGLQKRNKYNTCILMLAGVLYHDHHRRIKFNMVVIASQAFKT